MAIHEPEVQSTYTKSVDFSPKNRVDLRAIRPPRGRSIRPLGALGRPMNWLKHRKEQGWAQASQFADLVDEPSEVAASIRPSTRQATGPPHACCGLPYNLPYKELRIQQNAPLPVCDTIPGDASRDPATVHPRASPKLQLFPEHKNGPHSNAVHGGGAPSDAPSRTEELQSTKRNEQGACQSESKFQKYLINFMRPKHPIQCTRTA